MAPCSIKPGLFQRVGYTVSARFAVRESDPEVPVTVTVNCVGLIGGVEDPPPHPLSRPRPTTLTTKSKSICKRLRLFHPMQHNAAASIEPGKTGLEVRCKEAVVAVVVTVIVVQFTKLVPGVTVCGENVHDTPAEQLNETFE